MTQRMMTRIEQAVVEYDVCRGCGATVRTGAVICGENFDPHSRSGGFSPVVLWDGHPWDMKRLCQSCIKHEVFVVPTIQREVVGMVRVHVFDVERCVELGSHNPCVERFCQGGYIYNERGLRLSASPPSPEEIDCEYFSALYRVGERAIVLGRRWRHWMPLTVEWMEDLAHGDRKILVCEPTESTPWPTVIEPLWTLDEEEPADPERWGDDICLRAQPHAEPRLHPVRLRVPREILQ